MRCNSVGNQSDIKGVHGCAVESISQWDSWTHQMLVLLVEATCLPCAGVLRPAQIAGVLYQSQTSTPLGVMIEGWRRGTCNRARHAAAASGRCTDHWDIFAPPQGQGPECTILLDSATRYYARSFFGTAEGLQPQQQPLPGGILILPATCGILPFPPQAATVGCFPMPQVATAGAC